jgi:hypothetical protein
MPAELHLSRILSTLGKNVGDYGLGFLNRKRFSALVLLGSRCD